MIEIIEKTRPFSHRPGISCLIPQTSFEVEVFPALIRIYDIQTGERILIKEQNIPIKGPLYDFTVVQDLEKGIVTVFGKNLYFHIQPNLTISFQKKAVNQKLPKREKLFLGMHKKQDWDAILRRCDFREIFPIWFQLGTLFSEKMAPLKVHQGMFSLLQECREGIAKHRPEHILQMFRKIFLAGFRGMLVPRLRDDEHQGILFENTPLENPLYLIKEGQQLIRSLFIDVRQLNVHILPNLPPEFFSGSMVNLDVVPYGSFCLEWTKKMVYRLTLESSFDGTLPLIFHPSIKTCRIRRNEKEKGYVHACRDPINIKLNSFYIFDRFEK